MTIKKRSNISSYAIKRGCLIYLDSLVSDPGLDREELRQKFLQPPLYNKELQNSFVTLYGMLYDLEQLSATVFWPNKSLKQSFENFRECREMININKPNFGELVR